MPHSIPPQKLRLVLFCTAVALAVLCAFASYMSQFRDKNTVIITMATCAACSLFRGMRGQARRDLFQAYLIYHDTPMQLSELIKYQIRAALGWGLFDSVWLSANFTSCLALGIPGAFGIIFQSVFLYGFNSSQKLRPDMWDSLEKTQAMDMLESLLYAQACAAMIAAAFIIG